MTRDEIISMAREAGFLAVTVNLLDDPATLVRPASSIDCTPEIERFAALVAAREREQCALIADEWATDEQRKFGKGGPAAAIRARADNEVTK